MRNSFIILLLFSVVLNTSCSKSKVKDGLEGSWAIDNAYYNQEDFMYRLNFNRIEFFPNGKIKVPIVDGETILEDDRNVTGTWLLEAAGKEFYVTIKTKNHLFKGKYKVQFKENEEKQQLNLILSSDSLELECTKDFFNYRGRKSFVDEISNLTNSQ